MLILVKDNYGLTDNHEMLVNFYLYIFHQNNISFYNFVVLGTIIDFL